MDVRALYAKFYLGRAGGAIPANQSPYSESETSWNVAPTQDVGVIGKEDSGLVYKTMRWGLIPSRAKDEKIGAQCINARVETAETKPAFRSAFKSRRCLVPGRGYYEWKSIPGLRTSKPLKQPFYITRTDGLPFTFAGLWEKWKDGLLSFSILTTEAGHATRDLHGRMPLVLDGTGMEAWLAGNPPQLAENIDGAINLFPVSPRMNKPAYNAPDCIEPLAA